MRISDVPLTVPRMLARTAILGCLLALCWSASASAAVLKADYGFDNTLTSSVIPAPALTQVGTCGTLNNFATETVNLVADPVLVFDADCGLQLDTSTLVTPGSWTMALIFRFTDTSVFRRVFDASPGLRDPGLYVHNGALDFNIGFEQEGAAGLIAPDVYNQIVLSRDGASGQLTGYINGVQQFSVPDSTGDGTISAEQTPRFLIDNGAEASAGAVSRIRVYDAPLTPTEVATLDGNAPTDASIATTADSNPGFPGVPLGYTIAVSPGAWIATGAVVTDQLPASVDFVSASPGCTELNRLVTCTVGTVTVPTTLHIVVRPTAVTPALANTATIATTSPDPDLANNSSTATSAVELPADLSVAIAADLAQAVVGQAFGYSVSVTNHGPGTAQAVILTDPLSADVDFVSASAGCIANAGTVSCDLGSLAPGATATRRIVVRPTAPDPQLLNSATAQSGTGDLNLANNSAAVFVAVPAPVGLLAVPAGPAPGPGATALAPQAPAPGAAPPAAQTAATIVGKPAITPTTRSGLLRRGLRFTQKFSTTGGVRWTLQSGTTVLGRATRTLTKAGTVRITLKLGSSGRRLLARTGMTKLTLRTSFKPTGATKHTIVSTTVGLRG